jgi:hypothetical protein
MRTRQIIKTKMRQLWLLPVLSFDIQVSVLTYDRKAASYHAQIQKYSSRTPSWLSLNYTVWPIERARCIKPETDGLSKWNYTISRGSGCHYHKLEAQHFNEVWSKQRKRWRRGTMLQIMLLFHKILILQVVRENSIAPRKRVVEKSMNVQEA